MPRMTYEQSPYARRRPWHSQHNPADGTAYDREKDKNLAVNKDGVSADGTRYLTEQQRYAAAEKGERMVEKTAATTAHIAENTVDAYTHDRDVHATKASKDGTWTPRELAKDRFLNQELAAAKLRRGLADAQSNLGYAIERTAEDGKLTPAEQARLSKLEGDVQTAQGIIDDADAQSAQLKRELDAIPEDKPKLTLWDQVFMFLNF